MKITRRALLGATLAGTAVAGIAGCSDSAADGPLRFGFWGNDLRVKTFDQVVDLFVAAHPGVEVEAEYGDYDPYFERLAIQVAAGNAPDVISMDTSRFSEYAGREALADLNQHGISTAGFPDSLVDSGRIDGKVLGLAHGTTACALLASPAVFAERGIDLPDSTTWTWQDLLDVAAEITAGGEGITGLGGRTFLTIVPFHSFLAERDKRVFTREGAVGFESDDLAAWWQLMLKARDTGATASAQVLVEEMATEVDNGGLATGKLAMDAWWSNQLAAMNNASGESMQLLHPASEAGVTPPIVLEPAVYWTIWSGSQQPELAAKLINLFTSDQEAAKIIGTDRGIPGNDTARAAILDQLSDADKATVDYIGEDANAVLAPFPPPVGGSQWSDIYQRHATDVLFDNATAPAAAAAAVDELSKAIAD